MEFAEEELKMEYLAVRFKLEETRDEFKKVFEQCQEELRLKGTPQKTDTPVKEAEKVNIKEKIFKSFKWSFSTDSCMSLAPSKYFSFGFPVDVTNFYC
jgi:hypothetical protein